MIVTIVLVVLFAAGGFFGGMQYQKMQKPSFAGVGTGAGGGGFVLFFVEPSRKDKVRQALKDLLEVPFKFENLGSQVIFYQPDSGLIK